MMRKVWLVNLASVEELETMYHNYGVALAWPLTRNLRLYTRQGLEQLLTGAAEVAASSRRELAESMDNFVNRMRVNDFIVLAAGDEIALGELQSGYLYAKAGKEKFYGRQHYHMLRPAGIRKIDRCPAELLPMLKAKEQVADVSEYEQLLGNYIFHNQYDQVTTPEPLTRVSFQLRPDCSVNVGLPENLTKAEAEKLAGFVRTMVTR